MECFYLSVYPGLPKDFGWLLVPPQCYHAETASCHTINRPQAYPEASQRNLPDFALFFGFRTVEDLDAQGRNIFHVLFSTLKYCWLSAVIALECFTKYAAKMPGDYSTALRQPVEDGPIKGQTPLHVLCNGSDACLVQDKIVGLLLDNGIVPAMAFSWGHQSSFYSQLHV